MGFFGKIFGEAKPKIVELELSQASAFLEKELSPKRKQLLDSSAKAIAEVRHLLRETSASLKQLGSAQGLQRNNRLDKIVKTAKSNALTQLGSLLEKLRPPNTSDLDAVRNYARESILTMQQAGQFGKNIAYAGISFRDEMKPLSANMKRLAQAFASLQNLLNESKAVFLQKPFEEKLSEVRALEQGIASAEAETAKLKQNLEKAGLEKSRLESSLKRLREGSEFNSIGKLNEEKAGFLREKQKAKTELLDLFAKIERPLHRLDKAVKARKLFLPGEQASLLHQLLANPFLALKKDPKAETVKAILLETRKGIESGAIELKEREREKKLAVLQELLSFDFFADSFWRFNKLDSDLRAVERKLDELPAIREESKILESLKNLAANEASLRKGIELRLGEAEKARAGIRGLRLSIQGILSQATGQEVVLRA